MSTSVLILIGAVFYLALYFTYGKNLERKVVKADPNRPTPAVRMRDDVDFVPANKFVLFGHHFSSIAGAGPIVGPAIAAVWGWLPCVLWIWLGNFLIGAVHDYLSLMMSVRHDGKSVQWIAGRLMGKRTKLIFELYVFFALILVIAAFMGTFAPLASSTPEIFTTSVLFLVAAIIEGYLLYKTKLPFSVSTAIGIVMVALCIWLGFVYPIKMSVDALYWLQLIYIVLAAALPVWILLQPRDYLNSFILWGGVVVGCIAALIVFKPITWPAFTSFSANVVHAKVPSPFWPTVPLVIACGALSGFHSIVGSGTTSKQLDNELSGLFVGYGSMFTEGMLSTIVIASIGAFGLGVIGGLAEAIKAANPNLDATQLSDPSYMANFGNAIINLRTADNKAIVGGAVGLFTKSFGQLLYHGLGIPAKIGAVFGGLWVSAFVLTTLDTSNRLARYAFQEIVESFRGYLGGLVDALQNRWVGSLVAALLGFYFIKYGGAAYTALWAGFAGTNQLLASIAMLTAANWVKRVQKASGATLAMVFLPAVFLWVTVFSALVWYLLKVVPVQAAAIKGILGAFVVVMLILSVILLVNFWTTLNKEYKPSEEMA